MRPAGEIGGEYACAGQAPELHEQEADGPAAEHPHAGAQAQVGEIERVNRDP